MRFNEQATGVYAIAVTPFHPDGRVDTGSIDGLRGFVRAFSRDGVDPRFRDC